MSKFLNIFLIISVLSLSLEAGAWSKAWKKVRREVKVSYYKAKGDNEHAKKIRQQDKYKDLTIHKEDFINDFNNIKSFMKKHKKEILIGGMIVAGIYYGIPFSSLTNSEVEYGISKYVENKIDYSHLSDQTKIGNGFEFTQSQKEKIIAENIRRNGGVLKSDLSGIVLSLPQKYTKNYSPPDNEAQIDHIFPQSKGGSNSYENAQILSREENLKKSDFIQ